MIFCLPHLNGHQITTVLTRVLTLIAVFPLAVMAEPSDFSAAQQAAQEGRYEDVITILSQALEQQELDEADQVVALSNRGIALSLLGAHGRARVDLEAAVALNPEHELTLNQLGLLTEHVDENPAAAAEWYRQAARSGFAPAQVNLARLLVDGVGVERDRVRARVLLEQAAASDYMLAFVPLGRLYLSAGQSDRAVSLFEAAAAGGIAIAHFELAALQEAGRGIERDYAAAAQHYREAAMQGHAESQNRLGYLYRRGLGVERDLMEATKWYQLASDQGHWQATNRLAWLLAGCPRPEICNGPLAVRLARQAARVDRTPSVLDTLAAAEARVGNFDEAASLLDEAIALAETDGADTRAFSQRLGLYRQGKPFSL